MPYKVRKIRGQNEYKVFNTDTGVIHSHHATLDKAKAQLELLNETAGGKLPVSDIQRLLKQSYAATPMNYKDYTLDKELSGKRVQVHKKTNSPQSIVVHRGTKGIQDSSWGPALDLVDVEIVALRTGILLTTLTKSCENPNEMVRVLCLLADPKHYVSVGCHSCMKLNATTICIGRVMFMV